MGEAIADGSQSSDATRDEGGEFSAATRLRSTSLTGRLRGNEQRAEKDLALLKAPPLNMHGRLRREPQDVPACMVASISCTGLCGTVHEQTRRFIDTTNSLP